MPSLGRRTGADPVPSRPRISPNQTMPSGAERVTGVPQLDFGIARPTLARFASCFSAHGLAKDAQHGGAVSSAAPRPGARHNQRRGKRKERRGARQRCSGGRPRVARRRGLSGRRYSQNPKRAAQLHSAHVVLARPAAPLPAVGATYQPWHSSLARLACNIRGARTCAAEEGQRLRGWVLGSDFKKSLACAV